MTVEQTKDAIVAKLTELDKHNSNTDFRNEYQAIRTALLAQVEWLWSVMHYPNSKEWESVDAESALLAIAKELGVSDDS